MDNTQLHKLVTLIVDEVIRRVKLLQRQEQHPEEVLVLLTGPVTCPERMTAYLQERYGVGYTPVCFVRPPGITEENLLDATELPQSALLDMVSAARTVILAAPDVALLEKVASGDDGRTVPKLMIRSVLWQKDVRLLLDFEPPRFLRNTFLEGVASSIATLRSMGVQVEYYDTGQRSAQPRLELVTEQDVLAAAEREDKTLLCAMHAIVTPSARDAVSATGVILKY